MKKNSARFRFYEELNDFLPLSRRKVWFEYCFDGSPPVSDLISSLGVPHTQVDLILVNGESADFSHCVKNGDRISVYPVFESFDISEVSHLRPKSLRDLRFILDTHLGQLARSLQMLGLDVIYQHDYPQDFIIKTAESSNRILLTRNKELLRKKTITRGYLVRAKDPREQVVEVMRRFDLLARARLLKVSRFE